MMYARAPEYLTPPLLLDDMICGIIICTSHYFEWQYGIANKTIFYWHEFRIDRKKIDLENTGMHTRSKTFLQRFSRSL